MTLDWWLESGGARCNEGCGGESLVRERTLSSIYNSALFTVSWEHLNSHEASLVLTGNIFDEQLSS